jgi:hypothetical protein
VCVRACRHINSVIIQQFLISVGQTQSQWPIIRPRDFCLFGPINENLLSAENQSFSFKFIHFIARGGSTIAPPQLRHCTRSFYSVTIKQPQIRTGKTLDPQRDMTIKQLVNIYSVIWAVNHTNPTCKQLRVSIGQFYKATVNSSNECSFYNFIITKYLL